VRPQVKDAWPAALDSPRLPNPFAVAGRFIVKTLVIAELEVRKLRHDFTELIVRAIQPALWLILFGEVFTRVRAISTGDVSYLDFMAPGILAQSVLFVAIFYGIAIIWERDMGIVHKFLASPTPRGALVLGKSLAAGLGSLSQTVIIYVLALLLGVKMNWTAAGLLGVVATVILGAALFSALSLINRIVGQDARAVHGNGAGHHDAAVFCQQRDLSNRDDALLVTGADPLACRRWSMPLITTPRILA